MAHSKRKITAVLVAILAVVGLAMVGTTGTASAATAGIAGPSPAAAATSAQIGGLHGLTFRPVSAQPSGLHSSIIPNNSCPTVIGCAYVTIGNGNDGDCLGIQNASTSQGAPAIQWPCNNFPDQEWFMMSLGSPYNPQGLYMIININSNMCLGIREADTNEGAEALQWPCDGYNDQIWERPTNEYAQLVDFHSSMCLGIQDASTVAGTLAIQWPCDKFNDQHWNLTGL